MNTEDQKNELQGRLFDRFQGLTERFNHTYFAFLALIVLFFLLIFLPYNTIEIQKTNKIKRIRILEQMKTIKYAEYSLQSIRNMVQTDFRIPLQVKTEAEIHSLYQELKIPPPEFVLQSNKNTSGLAKNHASIVQLLAAESITIRAYQYQQQLLKGVIYPLIGMKIGERGELEKLSEDINDMAEIIKKYVHDSSNLKVIEPSEFNLQTSVYVVVDGNLRKDLESQAFILLKQIKKILDSNFWKEDFESLWSQYKSIEKVEDVTEELKGSLPILEKKIGDLSIRLNQLSTSFSKFQLNLKETVVLFPIFVAIGFFYLSLVYEESSQLRQKLVDLYHAEDPEKNLFTDDYTDFIAPLFAKYSANLPKRILHIFTLIVPAVIYVYSIIMIFLTWMTRANGTLKLTTVEWIFALLEVGSLFFIIFGGFRFQHSIRNN